MSLKTRVSKLERVIPVLPPGMTDQERRLRIESILASEPDSPRAGRIRELLALTESRRVAYAKTGVSQ